MNRRDRSLIDLRPLLPALTVLLATGGSIALAAEPTRSGDELCLHFLDPLEQFPNQSFDERPKPENLPAQIAAAWDHCQGEDVSPLLQARAALRYSVSRAAGSSAEKIQLFQQALTRIRASGETGIEEVQLLESISSLQGEAKDFTAARNSLEEAVERRKAIFGPESPEAARGMIRLGQALGRGFLSEKPEPKAGIALVEAGIATLVKTRGDSDPLTVHAKGTTIGFYRDLGYESKAKEIEDWSSSMKQRMTREQLIAAQAVVRDEWQ